MEACDMFLGSRCGRVLGIRDSSEDEKKREKDLRIVKGVDVHEALDEDPKEDLTIVLVIVLTYEGVDKG